MILYCFHFLFRSDVRRSLLQFITLLQRQVKKYLYVRHVSLLGNFYPDGMFLCNTACVGFYCY